MKKSFLWGIALTLFPFFALDAQEPVFSEPGGLRTEAFQLSLSPSMEGLQVYYTLDGRRPTRQNAHLYESPIEIAKNTVVSAFCADPAAGDGAIVTATYLFVDDVLSQSDSPEGYPSGWSISSVSGKDTAFFPADYGMDSAICQSASYKSLMSSALMSLPTLCLVTDASNLFSHSTDEETGGIYIHTGKSSGSYGKEWERPASLEYYDPQTGKSFQINCGLRLHGGNSRNPSNSPKHSFRVSFRTEYGDSKLKFRIFGDKSTTKKFDHLIFRAGYNYTWIVNGSKSLYANKIVQRRNAQYILDSFAKEVHAAMGNPITHRRFAHLYLNGIYWGMYEISEKINNDFVQAYLGGKDEDYDVVGDHNETIDGTRDIYSKMYAAAKAVTSSANDKNYALLLDSAWLDMANYIDYMLVNWYIGNEDWGENNWRTARSRVDPGNGFTWFVWDAETSLTAVDINKVTFTKGDPCVMMKSLKNHPEFKMLMADRIHRHLFNDGILTPDSAAALYSRLADGISLAVIAESARWGDYRLTKTGEAEETYTRDDYWLPRYVDLLENYFPLRTEFLLDQLIAADCYPKVAAPECSRWGGTFKEKEIALALTAPAGTVWYTLDGSDPREAYTSKVSSSAVKYQDSIRLSRSDEDTLACVTLKARCLSGSTWSALTEFEYRLEKEQVVDALPMLERFDASVAYCNGNLEFAVPENGDAVWMVYTLEGRFVAEGLVPDCSAGQIRSVSLELSEGGYLYRLVSGGRCRTGKFLAR